MFSRSQFFRSFVFFFVQKTTKLPLRSTSLDALRSTVHRPINYSTKSLSNLSPDAILKQNNIKEEYAIATTDSGFKHLLDSSNVNKTNLLKSFLNTFVPQFRDDKAEIIIQQPVAIPPVAEKDIKQTFMDLHVKTSTGARYIIEMQALRHPQFDERALFYACATYADQVKNFKDADLYQHLAPVIAVQVLGYDSDRITGPQKKNPDKVDLLVQRVKDNPMKKEQYMKHYVLTDEYSHQTIKHLQMIQIELPRTTQPLFPPTNDFTHVDWWLSILKHSNQYTEEMIENLKKAGIRIPEPFGEAFERLRIRSWNVTEIIEYVDQTAAAGDLAYHIQGERWHAKQEGIAEGISQGLAEGEMKTNRSIVLRMLSKGFDVHTIVESTHLTKEEIEKIKRKGGNETN